MQIEKIPKRRLISIETYSIRVYVTIKCYRSFASRTADTEFVPDLCEESLASADRWRFLRPYRLVISENSAVFSFDVAYVRSPDRHFKRVKNSASSPLYYRDMFSGIV
ncbi:hypothetical protein AVEN_201875-1 [Araneus ventricosus]|uniref:Uncharacterized protein n=1 Tax=Araneus ventricosus TaxID=182803 RepID=A0A4Y2J0A3_ARAVE|nr:hypothetical protein AVEN_201875-1 [Araneus ventricosus]